MCVPRAHYFLLCSVTEKVREVCRLVPRACSVREAALAQNCNQYHSSGYYLPRGNLREARTLSIRGVAHSPIHSALRLASVTRRRLLGYTSVPHGTYLYEMTPGYSSHYPHIELPTMAYPNRTSVLHWRILEVTPA